MNEEIKNGKYQKPGKVYYYRNNKLHREDGPAVEYPDGNKEWWLNGVEFTKEDFNKWFLHKKLQIKLKEKNVVRNFKI